MDIAPAGLPDAEATIWWVALGMSVVVVLVVILLLSFLVRLVKEIDAGVEAICSTLREIAGNTSHTTLIGETAERVDSVLDEGLTHHLFLGRKLAGQEPETLVGRGNNQ